MTDMKIQGVAAAGHDPLRTGRKEEPKAGGFDAVLQDALGKVTEVQAEAEKAIQELSAGGDVTRAVIAMEKADMSFQTMVEIRNRLLNAYDEIMRMQV